MRVVFLGILVGTIIVGSAFAAITPKSSTENMAGCGSCHDLPPIVDSIDGKYFAGAHFAHKEIGCSECHQIPGSVGHDDGIIDIRSEVNYSLGTKLSWPGGGGGSCGGGNSFSMPGDCHTEKKDMKCYWLPGDSCKSISAP